MDLIYSRYSSPLELIRLYIEQERFGELVTEILNLDYQRKKRELEDKEDGKLWFAYLLGSHEESFNDGKGGLFQTAGKTGKVNDMNMTEDDISNIIASTFQDIGRD